MVTLVQMSFLKRKKAQERGNPLASFITHGLGLLTVIMTAFLGPLARIVGDLDLEKGNSHTGLLKKRKRALMRV